MTNLPFIHYSDPKYQGGKEHIVYGSGTKNLKWIYSDRFDWSYKTRKKDGESDIEYWERILYLALQKKVEIKCVIGGCNQSNGFGYYVFGYKEIGESGESNE